MRRALLLLAALACISCVFAGEVSPDAAAKFLAGISAGTIPLQNTEVQRAWSEHSAEFDKAWKRLEQQQLTNIRVWAPQFFGDAYAADGPMFYMFSGPDFLYAHAFFPNASTYIFCGIEPVGSVPDLAKIPLLALPSALTNLRKSLESVLSWSFFITKNMKTDLNQTQLNGTLPVLYVFLARAGCTIDSVEPVALDRAGNFAPAGKSTTPGVKIVFHAANARDQTLYYFASDLSDSGIEANPGFMRFCDAQGHGASLLKAASYLMHTQGFSRVRDFLLAQSNVILQDDSGIPQRFFSRDKWTIRYCGRYVGPIDLFKQYPQPDLAQAFALSAPAPLPFGFGYQWQPSRSSLIIATPKVARALPLTPEEQPEETGVGE